MGRRRSRQGCGALCESQRETLVVSAASLWEIAIKCGVGGLRIADPARSLPDWLAGLGARVLHVDAVHTYAVYGLPRFTAIRLIGSWWLRRLQRACRFSRTTSLSRSTRYTASGS